MNLSLSIYLVLLTVALIIAAEDTESNSCSGHRQSPIVLKNDEEIDLVMEPLDLDNYGKLIKDAELRNNGHTAQLDMPPDASNMRIKGAMLNDEIFYLKQFHFHWGENDSIGSEHEDGSVFHPLEMHLVHTRDGVSLDNATHIQDDGIAVFAIFFEIGDEDNDKLDPLLSHFNDIKYAESFVVVPSIRLSDFLPERLDRFVTYNGSLTTPPCTENVVWIILSEFTTISHKQMMIFRHLESNKKGSGSDEYITHNYRKDHKLNSRSIFKQETKSGTERQIVSQLFFHLICYIICHFCMA